MGTREGLSFLSRFYCSHEIQCRYLKDGECYWPRPGGHVSPWIFFNTDVIGVGLGAKLLFKKFMPLWKWSVMAGIISSAVLYISAELLEWRTGSGDKYVILRDAGMQMIGAVLLTSIIGFNALSIVWLAIDRLFEHYSMNARSISFRIIACFLYVALSSLYVNVAGGSLFGSLVAVGIFDIIKYLFDGISFLVIHKRFGGKGLFLPIWILSSVLVDQAITGARIFYKKRYMIKMPTESFVGIKNLALEASFDLVDVRIAPLKRLGGNSCQSLFNELISINEGTITDRPESQISAIFAHEVGHCVNSDWIIDVILGSAYMAATGMIANRIIYNTNIFTAFGFPTEPPIVALTIAELVMSIVKSFLQPFELWLGRWSEHRADGYAKRKGLAKPLAEFLSNKKGAALARRSSKLYTFLKSTHPSLAERVERLLGFD